MRAPRSAIRAWLSIHVLLISVFLTQPSLAAGPEPPHSPQADLNPEVRSQLAEAAQDSTLEPWQREFMLGVARGNVEGSAAATVPALPGLAPQPAGTAADDGGWAALGPPSGRTDHTAIYDPVRDRMVVFGGFDGEYRNDVWVLSLAGSPAWSVLAPAGSPPSARRYHTAIYDPVRDRMVVFGGYDATSLRNDVWALSLSGSPAWSALTPAGSLPPPRSYHTAICDPVRNRMVVFGGVDGTSLRNDVWALSLSGSPAWSELAPAGSLPSARYTHTAIYDPVRDRMVVFGGYDGTRRNDVWALSLAGSPAWSVVGPAGSLPDARNTHTAIYDPVRDRMVVFGGYDASGLLNDVWALSLAGSPAWSALTPAGSPPFARYSHTAIYDPVRDRMVVFGGYDETAVTPAERYIRDVWALSLAGSPAWSELAPAGSPPSKRYGHTAIYDPVRDRMVVFGGTYGNPFNDVWAFSLSGSPNWSALTPAGSPPSRRDGHTAIYDPVRDRMVVFGGSGPGIDNDVWALSLAGNPAWSALNPAGSQPPARSDHTAIYDPVRDRMLVFGGYGLNDVWALSLAGSPAWSALTPAGSPPSARRGHTAIYDPVRDRMVVFGGFGLSLNNDVWALSLAGSPAWSELAPAGSPPSARYGHGAIYDPVRDRMVVFGGGGALNYNDVWALSLAGSTAWSALAPNPNPPSAGSDDTAIYDPVRDRMVVFGGGGSGSLDDVWALSWDQTTPTLLARFEAEVTSAGVRLRWQFGEPDRVVSVALERAGNQVGPWMPLMLDSRRTADAMEALDPIVTEGDTYYYRLTANLTDGTRAVYGPISAAAVLAVKISGLTGIAPNPASGTARIDFALVRQERVRISVLDIAGREVAILADEQMTPGSYSMHWDGRQGGAMLPGGVYFVRWASVGRSMNRKLVMLP